MKTIYTVLILTIFFFAGCSKHKDAVKIDDNTFVHDSKVYRIVDNEVMQISDLDADNTRKYDALKTLSRDLGKNKLDQIKANATAHLTTLYRNNRMYFRLNISGLNDLLENYERGTFTVQFYDSLAYVIYSVKINSNELTAIIGRDGKSIVDFSYTGISEMPLHSFEMIESYEIASSVSKKERNYDGWMPPPAPYPQ